MTEQYTDRILREADMALDALEESLCGPGGQTGSGFSPNDTALLDIEFGTARVPISNLPELLSGQIVNLDDPAIPTVKLYFGGVPAAEGLMMVQDGKIAVKITRKLDSESEERERR